MVERTPWIRHWGENQWTWNHLDPSDDDEGAEVSDGSGMPGRAVVAGAILLWAESCPGATPSMVARVFNLPLPFAEDAFRPDIFRSSDLGEAIQTWSLLVGGDVSVASAASTFGRSPSEIVRVVADHPWMYLETRGGVSCIGHEGE